MLHGASTTPFISSLTKHSYTTKKLFSKSQMYVLFMWQTKFYTQHELTCIWRALSAASSSCLQSVFGSNQLHAATIDTLPEEGIRAQCLLHSYNTDISKILLKLGHRKFLTNQTLLFLFSSFQTQDWMLPVPVYIKSFLVVKIIH
jgi:hypothetical protein